MGPGSCTRNCGGGVKFLTKSCTNPKPSLNGRDCEGVTKELVREWCNTQVSLDYRSYVCLFAAEVLQCKTIIRLRREKLEEISSHKKNFQPAVSRVNWMMFEKVKTSASLVSLILTQIARVRTLLTREMKTLSKHKKQCEKSNGFDYSLLFSCIFTWWLQFSNSYVVGFKS